MTEKESLIKYLRKKKYSKSTSKAVADIYLEKRSVLQLGEILSDYEIGEVLKLIQCILKWNKKYYKKHK